MEITMRKLFESLFIASALFGCSVGIAQTLHWQSAGLDSVSISCVAVHDTMVFAGTSRGLYRSSDDGVTWQSANTGLLDSTVTALNISGTTLFAGTSSRGVHRSTNNGDSWTPFQRDIYYVHFRAGAPLNKFYSMSLVDPDTITVRDTVTHTNVHAIIFVGFGRCSCGALTDQFVLTCDTLGRPWMRPGDSGSVGIKVAGEQDEPYSWGPVSIQSFKTTTYGYAVHFSGRVKIGSDSVDLTEGDMFAPLIPSVYDSTIQPPTSVNAIATIGQQLFVAFNDFGMYSSADGGTAWNQINNVLPPNATVQSLAVIGSTLFAGVNTSVTGGIFRSMNNGALWTQVDSAKLSTQIATLFVDGTTLLAGTTNGVRSTMDNADTWQKINGGISDSVVTAFASTGASLYAGTFGDGVYRSTNGGVTWMQENSGLKDTHVSSLVSNGTYIFAASPIKGLFRANVLGGSGVSNDALTSPALFLTAQPNPVRDRLIVNYATGHANAEISVTNILGERLMSETHSATGAGMVSLNTGALPAGIYNLSLSSGNTTVNRIVMVVR